MSLSVPNLTDLLSLTLISKALPDSFVPSNVKLASLLTVVELTEVTTLLLPLFVYDEIAADDNPVNSLPSPTNFEADICPLADIFVNVKSLT